MARSEPRAKVLEPHAAPIDLIHDLKDAMHDLRGGSNISPVEVEVVLTCHPAVKDAAVVGVPDETLGQRVAGFVQLEDDAQSGIVNEILDAARAKLAD